MANIIPKLNLNKTPNITENNSLVFAKNIRADIDGSIHKDYSIIPITWNKENGQTKVYNSLINKIKADIAYYKTYHSSKSGICDYISTKIATVQSASGSFSIVGQIANTDEFYIFVKGTASSASCTFILVYKESNSRFEPCDCNWTYSGGKIDGCIINNLYGEKILSVGETSVNGSLIPLKHINLSTSKYNDDESIYTQAPNIPFINLNINRYFDYVIPNGVYQFFVRYKIRENHYTNWFPASRELFASNTNKVSTNFGTLKYINTHTDATQSFVFDVSVLFDSFKTNYENFQIGFILSHDDAIYARAWKHFSFNDTIIQFDYKASDAEEIEVTDFTKPVFNLYNVGNITNFKNKVYISNYTETNFNEDLTTNANSVRITLGELGTSDTYNGYPVSIMTEGGTKYITAMKINTSTAIKDLCKELFYIKDGDEDNTSYYKTLKDWITISISGNSEQDTALKVTKLNASKYGINLKCSRETVATAQERFQASHSGSEYHYNHDAYSIEVGNDKLPISNNDPVGWAISKLYNNITKMSSSSGYILTATITIRKKATYKSGDTVKEDSYFQTINVTLTGDPTLVSLGDISTLTNKTSLVPLQKYKFYIHYVKQSGETTNGYLCKNGTTDGIIEVPYKWKCNTIIYPVFNDITYPSGYVACFFSIHHCSNNVSTVFNIKDIYSYYDQKTYVEGSSMELNLRLLPMSKVKTSQDGKTFIGKYYMSGDSSAIRYFGADGIINFGVTSDISLTKVAYTVSDYESQQESDVSLIKCTPYIKGISDNNKDNYSLQGYVCECYTLDRERSTKYYSDGSSIYMKKESDYCAEMSNPKITFIELGKYSDSDPALQNFNLINSASFLIYSNYNLNHLSLTEDVKHSIKTYYNGKASDTDPGPANNLFCRLLTSATLCDVYSFPSMYHNYTKKTYSTYNSDSTYKFNNTVRSSALQGDEAKISIFKFEANDYYNVPTNRGIIVNMVSIGDSILVHTKDSMFRFSGSNNLSGSTGEIVTAETEPFNTGVAEIFGSEYGFAGLQNKEDNIITENGYIFFDRDSRIVYLYAGQNQLTKISDSIEKLFKWRDITHVNFANDFYNNRFFMSITFDNGTTATLSFSLIEGIKSFVSLHDFYFTESFNTKTKCYFLNSYKSNIYKIDTTSVGLYEGLNIVTNTNVNKQIFPYSRTTKSVSVYNLDNAATQSYSTYDYNSIVDIIDNTNYEKVKTLNYISWISNKVIDSYQIYDANSFDSIRMTEYIDQNIAAYKLRIYSDTCISKLINVDIKSNDYSISNPNSYKLPRYNQGKWTLNYFRDIENVTDIFNYTTKYTDGRVNSATLPDFVSDNNSLLEGKYFVTRFIFIDEFKLETLETNYTFKI